MNKLHSLLLGFIVLLIIPFQTTAQFNYLPTQHPGEQLIQHKYYSLSYHEAWEQPSWVAYELTPKTLQGTTKRTNNFRTDPAVKTGSATLSDYRKSGFDRGHLLPAGSMKCTSEAMSQTFYMSNMSPQRPYFNRGIWKKLEGKVRSWTRIHKKLYIVSGPIILTNHKTIGPNKVAVPQQYFKVILDLAKKQAIAFILPNKKSNLPLSHFAVSIDQVEKQTGIDFFPQLPNQLEKKLESKIQTTPWF